MAKKKYGSNPVFSGPYLVAATWPQELYGYEPYSDFEWARTVKEANEKARNFNKLGAISTYITMILPKDLPELNGKHVCSECGGDNISFSFSPDVPLNGTVDFVINGDWGIETLLCWDCGDNIENVDWVPAA